jgi:phospholipase A1
MKKYGMRLSLCLLGSAFCASANADYLLTTPEKDVVVVEKSAPEVKKIQVIKKEALTKKQIVNKKVELIEHNAPTEIEPLLDSVTPDKNSVLETRIKKERLATNNPLSIILYQPTYILPYYYTASPYTRIYQGQTPNNQNIMRNEFKAQLSLRVPLVGHVFNQEHLSLNLGYTQLSYWQVYASSQYFRETNYEPEIFLEDHFHHNWIARIAADHQSNGRGGALERSWNRIIGTVQFSGEHWLVGLKTWGLIFTKQSSNYHNPDIAKFVGYENVLLAYTFEKATLSFQAQNLESGLRRGHVEMTLSYPMLKHVSMFVQYFNGYGQSMLEYNHRTQGAGLGIAFNDWA